MGNQGPAYDLLRPILGNENQSQRGRVARAWNAACFFPWTDVASRVSCCVEHRSQ